MGGFDRFSRTIPRNKVAGASSYRFEPLTGGAGSGGASVRPGSDAARHATGYEAGFAQGVAEAQRAAQAHRNADLAKLDVVLSRLQGALDGTIAGAADQVLDLALAIARQVLRDEIAMRPEAILPVVREALGALVEAHGHPTVRLAPSDYESVRTTLAGETQLRGVRFLSDPAIAPGGCRVDTPHIEVDATVGTRWRRVLQTLGSEAPGPADAPAGTPADKPEGANGSHT
jgi:flagellar assembly protein FliH